MISTLHNMEQGHLFFGKIDLHRSEHKLAAHARRLVCYIYVPPAWMVIYFAKWKLQLRKSNLVGCALHFTFGRLTREAGAARVDSLRVVRVNPDFNGGSYSILLLFIITCIYFLDLFK